jgi:hypothetical protein
MADSRLRQCVCNATKGYVKRSWSYNPSLPTSLTLILNSSKYIILPAQSWPARNMTASEKKVNDDAFGDPQKIAELSPNPTIENGIVKETRRMHVDLNDGDIALKAFAGHEGEILTMTPEQEKALLRKIDWNLMPVRVLVRLHSQPILTDNTDALCCVWSQLP